MTFDVDEAIKVLREFTKFMRTHEEPKWADALDECEAELVAADEDYERARNAFRELIGRIWGGAQGGGLFEEPDQKKWQKKPEALRELLIFRGQVHDLWAASKKEEIK